MLKLQQKGLLLIDYRVQGQEWIKKIWIEEKSSDFNKCFYIKFMFAKMYYLYKIINLH